MDAYVKRLLDLPPLSKDEEIDLARRMRDGDGQAREALIESGLRHVALHAVMRGWRGADLLDAVQSGSVGLIAAVDHFDPEHGARLATYAWRWIGHSMSVTRPEHVPSELVERLDVDTGQATVDVLADLPAADAAVLRERFRIGEEPGRPRTRQEVARRLGLTLSQVRTREARAMRQVRDRLATVVHRAPQRGADPP